MEHKLLEEFSFLLIYTLLLTIPLINYFILFIIAFFFCLSQPKKQSFQLKKQKLNDICVWDRF
jgi:preprotein translocase subunit YajC